MEEISEEIREALIGVAEVARKTVEKVVEAVSDAYWEAKANYWEAKAAHWKAKVAYEEDHR